MASVSRVKRKKNIKRLIQSKIKIPEHIVLVINTYDGNILCKIFYSS